MKNPPTNPEAPVLGNHAAHGFSGVLTKPYRLAELSEAVAAVQAG